MAKMVTIRQGDKLKIKGVIISMGLKEKASRVRLRIETENQCKIELIKREFIKEGNSDGVAS